MADSRSAPEPSSLEAQGLALEDLVPSPAAAHEPDRAVQLRTARVLGSRGRRATIALRGRADPVEALIADEVDVEIVADAAASGDAVLVEQDAGESPVIVGALRTRRPTELRLRAAKVELEGEDELVLRSGRAAIRIRADGEIEIVGTRISAAARGIFRIVGRILRLN